MKSEAPQTQAEKKRRDDNQKSHSAQKIKVGRAVFQKGSHTFSPFHRMTKSLQDQNTNSFKEKHFMVFSAEGKSIQPLAIWEPTPFLQKHVMVLEKISVLQDPAGVAFESF